MWDVISFWTCHMQVINIYMRPTYCREENTYSALSLLGLLALNEVSEFCIEVNESNSRARKQIKLSSQTENSYYPCYLFRSNVLFFFSSYHAPFIYFLHLSFITLLFFQMFSWNINIYFKISFFTTIATESAWRITFCLHQSHLENVKNV